MQWSLVSIKDKKGIEHKGEGACEFVLDNIDPRVVVKNFSGDKFSLTVGGRNLVGPDEVHRALTDGLSGRFVELRVHGVASQPRKVALPNLGTENVLNVVPTYTLTFELGDIDALFDPVGNTAEPWKDKGVHQRLQALGYLYTPLLHPGNTAAMEFAHSKGCWQYFLNVHGLNDNTVGVNKLKEELAANLIAKDLPKSRQVLSKSSLPGPKETAAIRFPGGYGTTKSAGTHLRGGDHKFNGSVFDDEFPEGYDFEIGDPRDEIELKLVNENPIIGKFPLIAKVMKQFPGKEPEPAPDVPVHFELVMPDDIPANSQFAAAPLPDKLMNYSLEGLFWPTERYPDSDDYHKKLFKREWTAVHRIAHAAHQNQLDGKTPDAMAQAGDWIDRWCGEAQQAVPWDNVKDWWLTKPSAFKTPKQTDPLTRFAMELDAAKKHIREQIVPPPSRPAKGYDSPSWKLLVRLVRAAVSSTANKQLAKTTAQQWIDAWAAGGAAPQWADVSAWWGDQNDQPYSVLPRTKSKDLANEDPIRFAREQVDTILRDFEPPSKPDSFDAAQWECIRKIAITAKRNTGTDSDAAIRTGETWIDLWASTELLTWPQVQDWWKHVNEKPYPTLRTEMKDTAKDRVKFLLDDEAFSKTRQNEISDVAQKRFMEALVTKLAGPPDNNDPQKWNAPKQKYGGKYGGAIEEVLVKGGGEIDGFHNKRPTQVSDHGKLKLAKASSRTHAVMCDTNDKGFAGTIFTPSRCGGDRYRLRAQIDEEWLTKNAPGPVHVSKVETGTFVVWRNIRIYRYLQLRKAPAPLSVELQALLREGNCNMADPKTFGKMFLNTPLSDLLVIPGQGGTDGPYPPLSIGYLLEGGDPSREQLLKYRPLSVSGVHFQTHFRQAYCELISDSTGIEAIAEDELRQATEVGKAAFDECDTKQKDILWDKLLIFDPTSPFLVNLRGFKNYNSLLTQTERATYNPLNEDDGSWFGDCMAFFIEAMCEHFAGGGVLPGLTLVQIPRGDTWDQFAADGVCASPITSGYGTASRAAFLSWTDGKYKDSFIYPATSNCLHEIGHVLGLCHQFSGGGFIDNAHQEAVKEKYQDTSKRPADPEKEICVCVMSYSGCYGDFCAVCLLSLRGWKTHTMQESVATRTPAPTTP